MGNGKFKVGDSVKTIHTSQIDEDHGVRIGDIGKVLKVNGNVCNIKYSKKLRRASGTNLNLDGSYAMWTSQLELIETLLTTVIIRRDSETIATLKDGKTILKTAKATCNPSDTFNAEFGRALALARLNDDQKMIDFLLKSEEKPFVPTQARIVKQDKYEVGDKVKIIDKWVPGCYPNPEGDMDKWLGKIVTIDRGDNRIYRILEDSGSWNWYELAIEGKVIEEPVTSGQPVDVPVIVPFDWDGFKSGKYAVHCDTEEKAKQFFDELKMQGIKWCNGEELKRTRWDIYKELTHYGFWDSRETGICYGTFYGDSLIKIPYIPNYREVKRPAKVGEWIRVVNAHSFSENKYKNDDVLQVESVKSNGEASFGDCGTWKTMMHDEYVVLEPTVHSKDTVAPQYTEVKRRAKIGESIKVVKVGRHVPQLIIGDVHKVVREDQFRGLHTNKSNVFNSGEHDEYVVLDPVAVVSQPEVNFDLSTISDEYLLAEVSRRLKK